MESRARGSKLTKKLVSMLVSPKKKKKKHSLLKQKQKQNALICGKGLKSGGSEKVYSNTVIHVKWLIEV